MADIEWAEPPARGGGRGPYTDWRSVADQLRSKPGQWAKVKSDTTDVALALRIKRAGSRAWSPQGAFEARTVNVAKGRVDVYARYVGEVSA